MKKVEKKFGSYDFSIYIWSIIKTNKKILKL